MLTIARCLGTLLLAVLTSQFDLCVLQMRQSYDGGGGILHLQIFFFSSSSFLKVRTQRPLRSGQPTLQMAGGSEAVSTLKRAKSRGFSPAGEDRA